MNAATTGASENPKSYAAGNREKELRRTKTSYAGESSVHDGHYLILLINNHCFEKFIMIIILMFCS
jgi:hypothetical protein